MGQGYSGLKVYQLAFKLALEVHELTKSLPRAESFELGSQVRRSSKSISVNIAEGYGRKRYEKDFIRFLINAIGSTDETRVHLDFAQSLGYLSEEKHQYFDSQYKIVGKQLSKLISTLDSKNLEKI